MDQGDKRGRMNKRAQDNEPADDDYMKSLFEAMKNPAQMARLMGDIRGDKSNEPQEIIPDWELHEADMLDQRITAAMGRIAPAAARELSQALEKIRLMIEAEIPNLRFDPESKREVLEGPKGVYELSAMELWDAASMHEQMSAFQIFRKAAKATKGKKL